MWLNVVEVDPGANRAGSVLFADGGVGEMKGVGGITHLYCPPLPPWMTMQLGNGGRGVANISQIWVSGDTILKNS